MGPAGGIVIYVGASTINVAAGISDGGKYLEAAPSDPSRPLIDWCNGPSNGNSTLIGANSALLGAGASNTAIMDEFCESGAGNLAADYSVNEYSDWFLPSTAELEYLSAQKTAVGLSESDLYWGSNELEPYVAASLVVGTRGEVGGQFKADPTPWWPIRAFSPVTYTITLTVGTNGSGGDRILTKTNGVALTLEDSSEANSYFTRAGYRVTGWSTSDGGAQTHALSGAFTTDAATTLYPVWTINPPAPIVVYVAPTPVPYLRTLTPPKINFRDGKLVCTPGTYNTGYTLDGVVQGSTTSLFTPSTFTYNLLINGVTQASLSVTSSTATTTWNLPTSTSGSLLSCSVTVSANGVTNIDKSSDNTSATSSALTTQATSIATANADYSALLSANSKAYQKALVDNRATWRKQIDAIRSNYYDTLNRIKAKGGSKMIADKSTALKVMIAAQKKSAADYKASQPAAAAARDAANKAALATKTAAIAKANATYGTFIESIGYGVLIP